MRIALVPSAFAPRVGGVEVLTDRLARTLQATGHEVEVWTARTRGDELLGRELMNGLSVRRFAFDAPRASPIAMVAWPFHAIATLVRMRKAAGEFRPDVLHVQCFSGNGVYSTLLGAISGIPVVVTLQGETFMDDHEIYDRSVYLRTMLRIGLRRASGVTGCSRYTLDDAVQRVGQSARRGRVIYNGVHRGENQIGQWQAPQDRYVLGLGRVVHRKGFDLLIQAWARIAQRHEHVQLIIGGDGPELPVLEQLVDDLALKGRVRLAGPMSRADVADAMRQADVFVMPSRVEAFGIVVLEAWRGETATIVTANGGPPEFVRDEVDGLVIDPRDVGALARGIERLLNDGELRRRLTASAIGRLPEFEWDEIARQYVDVYEGARG